MDAVAIAPTVVYFDAEDTLMYYSSGIYVILVAITDCALLMGRDPVTGSATKDLLGPYTLGYSAYECEVQSAACDASGQLAWSAIWLRINYTDPAANTNLATNIATNANNLWTNMATLTAPAGLILPGTNGLCGFFGSTWSNFGSASAVDPANPSILPASAQPFYACSAGSVAPGSVSITAPQKPSPTKFSMPNGISLKYPLVTSTNPLVQCSTIIAGASPCASLWPSPPFPPSPPASASIRLVGGATSMDGRVEVFLNGVWGPVCDDNWEKGTNLNAQVVCKSLGLPSAGAYARIASYYQPASTSAFAMDDVACTGTEDSILNCPRRASGTDCTLALEQVGVVCTAVSRRTATGGVGGISPIGAVGPTSSSSQNDAADSTTGRTTDGVPGTPAPVSDPAATATSSTSNVALIAGLTVGLVAAAVLAAVAAFMKRRSHQGSIVTPTPAPSFTLQGTGRSTTSRVGLQIGTGQSFIGTGTMHTSLAATAEVDSSMEQA
jgi:hypothetical protein